MFSYARRDFLTTTLSFVGRICQRNSIGVSPSRRGTPACPILVRGRSSRAGCRKIYEDRVSGVASQRPGLEEALAALGAGDVLVVWKLDRLGRSLQHLIEVIGQVGQKKAGFRSLSESIDTTTAGGRLVFHLMGSLAEFERALIAERTRAGLAAAKRRGTRLGRRPALSPPQVKHARVLLEKGESATAVARTLRVGRSTLYRALGGQLSRS